MQIEGALVKSIDALKDVFLWFIVHKRKALLDPLLIRLIPSGISKFSNNT